jgi:hypothetical protein
MAFDRNTKESIIAQAILPKSPLAPLCQIPRNAGLPLVKGGKEGFSSKRLYNYGLTNNWATYNGFFLKVEWKKGDKEEKILR